MVKNNLINFFGKFQENFKTPLKGRTFTVVGYMHHDKGYPNGLIRLACLQKNPLKGQNFSRFLKFDPIDPTESLKGEESPHHELAFLRRHAKNFVHSYKDY